MHFWTKYNQLQAAEVQHLSRIGGSTCLARLLEAGFTDLSRRFMEALAVHNRMRKLSDSATPHGGSRTLKEAPERAALVDCHSTHNTTCRQSEFLS